MNMGCAVVEAEETHSERCDEGADGAKNSLGWRDTRDLLCEVHGLDGHIQRGESPVPPVRSLGLGFHGSESPWRRENGVARRLRRRVRTVMEIGDRPQNCSMKWIAFAIGAIADT